MSTQRSKRHPPRSVGEVLTEGRKQLMEERGKYVSFATIAKELAGDSYRIDVSGETIRAYHADEGGEKKNALVLAGLVDLYGLKVTDLPADEAGRIDLALKLLKRVARSGRTPPGTRTRNLQDKGTRQHPSSARFVTKDAPISQVEAA